MVHVGRSVHPIYDSNTSMRYLAWHIEIVIIIIIIIIISTIIVFIVVRFWDYFQVRKSQRGIQSEAAAMLWCAHSSPVRRFAETLELRPL